MLRAVLILTGLALTVALAAPDYLVRLADRGEVGAAPPVSNPAATVAAESDHGGVMRISADRGGHYASDVEINGRMLRAIVDTGATLVILRYEDARSLGVIFPGDRFDVAVRTANGTGKARRVELRSIRLGPITLRDVEALVVEPGALQTQNLLGMSFLKRLSRFEVRRDVLVLER